MTDHHDEHLRELLDDAVSHVEPADRLTEIRSRTAAARSRRRGWSAAGGAALVAAAVVVAVAVVSMVSAGDDGDGAPDAAAPRPTTPASTSPAPAGTTPVYYVGPGPGGAGGPDAALYRYFEPEGDPLELLMSTPSDPDYRTWWPAGSLESFEVRTDEIVVVVDRAVTGAEDLAWQQVVHTLHASTGTTLPVRFDNSGVDLGDIDRAAPLDVLSHVNISDPGEEHAYAGAFTARGVGHGFEGTVACRLIAPDGSIEWEGATISGWEEPRLYPWELEVDLAGVSAGELAFSCSTDDPDGGATYTDTRTIRVTDEPQRGPGATTTAYDTSTGRSDLPVTLERGVEPGDHTFRCQTDDPTGGTEGRGADADTRSITVEG